MTSQPNWKGHLPGIICPTLHPVDSIQSRDDQISLAGATSQRPSLPGSRRGDGGVRPPGQVRCRSVLSSLFHLPPVLTHQAHTPWGGHRPCSVLSAAQGKTEGRVSVGPAQAVPFLFRNALPQPHLLFLQGTCPSHLEKCHSPWSACNHTAHWAHPRVSD